MSEEQLTVLLAKIKEDAGLQEKLKGAADLDAAFALAKEAGFDVSKADWLKYQAKQILELSENSSQPTPNDDPRPIVTSKSPCKNGAFCFFNHTQATHKRPRYLAPYPTSVHNIESLFLSNNSQVFQPTGKPAISILGFC
jgi:predicted ribosomally synthesized peptide with nif11-like leader